MSEIKIKARMQELRQMREYNLHQQVERERQKLINEAARQRLDNEIARAKLEYKAKKLQRLLNWDREQQIALIKQKAAQAEAEQQRRQDIADLEAVRAQKEAMARHKRDEAAIKARQKARRTTRLLVWGLAGGVLSNVVLWSGILIAIIS